MIDAAKELADLSALPGIRPEALEGDRRGQYSVRINDRYRLQRAPLHPGQILREQFMAEFGVSINRLARDLRVPPTRISEIVNEGRAVSTDTALRLARYFRTSAEFWVNLQSAYDLDVARTSVQQRIDEDVRPIAAA
jgi:addiction module HigA family antidote